MGMDRSNHPRLVAARHRRAEPSARTVDAPLRGILVEIANTGVVRYPWPLLRTLILHVLEGVVTEFDAGSAVEVGQGPAGSARRAGGEGGAGAEALPMAGAPPGAQCARRGERSLPL